MDAVSASETSVNFNQATRRNIPDDSHLHTRHRENLTFHLHEICLVETYEHYIYEYEVNINFKPRTASWQQNVATCRYKYKMNKNTNNMFNIKDRKTEAVTLKLRAKCVLITTLQTCTVS
jgi:hypothetical protein